MNPRPFTRLSRRVLVDNPWHRYCVDRYVRRDGTEGRYFYIEIEGAAGIIPIFDDGTTLLCRQWRYLLGTHLWEFPIGGLRPGQDAEEAARHELEEEAGLRAARWTRLGAFAPYKGVSTEHTTFFLAEGLEVVTQRLEPEEDITLHRMPFEEARARLLDQPLGDAQSWGGLILFDRFRAVRGTGSA